MKLLLLASTLTLAISLPSYAQPALPRVHANNFHGWWNYFGDHPIGGSKWGVHLEGQWRRHDVAARW